MEDSMDLNLSCLEIKDRKRSHDALTPPNVTLDKSEVEPRRSNRKRIRPADPIPNKVQVRTRPKKLLLTSSLKDIENYYLDKKVKVGSPALETIFEEPTNAKSMMSVRKFKRSINFHEDLSAADKLKAKKRSMKAKKMCANNRVNIKKKDNMAMTLLLNKLDEVEETKNENVFCES